MLDWVKKLIGVAKASEDKIGLDEHSWKLLAEDFAALDQESPEISQRILRYNLADGQGRVCSPRFPSFQILSIGCAFDWKILSFDAVLNLARILCDHSIQIA